MLYRFRGAIAGAVLGKMWALRVASFPGKGLWALERSIDFRELNRSHPFGNADLVDLISKQLIENGRLMLDEDSAASLTIPWADGNTAQLDADVWVALLPIVLFFHEDDARLASNLQQVTATWKFSSEATETVLGAGYAIALALREALNPAALVPQTLNYLNIFERDALSLQFPNLLQTLLDRGSSLESVKGLLGQQTSRQNRSSSCTPAAALAFYCFLETPEDFRVCLMRSLQAQYQPQLVATIAGAIVGAYNGYEGIPLSWRMALNPESESKSEGLATQLWAAWSGICDPTQSLDKLEKMAAVTAPGVLRPR
ncbi:ADP-ribosylglycohydrolase family protein [Oscillatoriales cyanobacterium LEGE 11467]|uniref:ADP-ribosylglycohydrolase family protein n=1 Tax=Zarconia navalis LEGE 11467 TaxID=1828826 RepID=A0A928VTZ0_9CYAN|nr:ADP-ribosylglycohydrolase family protein [Zarconia navalis]MBE9040212.1 ADP-ribosylglycohydrolase family protein [Zarconia navalis LEGE 11467]